MELTEIFIEFLRKYSFLNVPKDGISITVNTSKKIKNDHEEMELNNLKF